MKIDIEILSNAHDAEVKAFLDALSSTCPSVLGYHYPFYRDMLVELGVGKAMYLGARVDGLLVGLLPAFCRESEVGIVYCSLPFFGPNGGVLSSDGPNSNAVHSALLQYFLEYTKHANALSCAIYTPLLFEDFDLYDRFQPSAVVERVTQVTRIKECAWSSGIRYDLRRAERLGVRVEEELSQEKLAAFYQIYQSNCEEYGIPLKPPRCVQLLASPEIVDTHTHWYFAMQSERVIGGLLVIRSPATASYYIPCTLKEARALQPGTVLIDRAVQSLKEVGVQTWNWEASPSMESGVYRYKEKWNAVKHPYRIYVWAHRGVGPLVTAGKQRIAQAFPHFFVYPFDKL